MAILCFLPHLICGRLLPLDAPIQDPSTYKCLSTHVRVHSPVHPQADLNSPHTRLVDTCTVAPTCLRLEWLWACAAGVSYEVIFKTKHIMVETLLPASSIHPCTRHLYDACVILHNWLWASRATHYIGEVLGSKADSMAIERT